MNSHSMNSPIASALMDSPAANTMHAQQQQHFQGLSQDSPLGPFDHNSSRWNDSANNNSNKGPEMFHIASPPLTPSGVMARSPSSYNTFGMNNSVKRPPLWPMDRPIVLPFPRQTPTPSQSSKGSWKKRVACLLQSWAKGLGIRCMHIFTGRGPRLIRYNNFLLPTSPLSTSFSCQPPTHPMQVL